MVPEKILNRNVFINNTLQCQVFGVPHRFTARKLLGI